jgi:outer membrane protein TolC
VRLSPAESLDTPVSPLVGNPKQLTSEALTARYEIKSIDANAASARKQLEVTRAGSYPQVSAFADGIYANPNPRRFPATEEWFPTWDVGAQLTWSPNDMFSTRSLAADAESRVRNLEAQRMVMRDGIEVEVLQMWQGVKESDFALESTKREVASATEAYRVARELFLNGKGTSTTLTDAETELTRARLDQLNAVVDAHVARVRLDHALGRDTRPFVSP